jgi:hypothetical protein
MRCLFSVGLHVSDGITAKQLAQLGGEEEERRSWIG